MKNFIEKIKNAYTNNRVFRTFIQSVGGYVAANLTYAVQAMATDGKGVGKVLLYTLIIPAVSTGLSALMNAHNEESEGE